MSQSINGESKWKGIYVIGAMAAVTAVLEALLEIFITFLPGGNASQETVLDWFLLFQENWLLELRNLGLLNVFLNTLGILTFFAIYAAHRCTDYQPYAALGLIISLLGIGVFFGTNRAFPMLDLSNQYAAAATEPQRAMLEAAGQSMLSVGESHSPGTFLGFFLLEVAGFIMSVVMLRGQVFSKLNAYLGILGFTLLLTFEFFSSFITGLSNMAMILAMLGGLLSMAWYILTARRLFRLGRSD